MFELFGLRVWVLAEGWVLICCGLVCYSFWWLLDFCAWCVGLFHGLLGSRCDGWWFLG